jgi:hypothetical protein
MKSITLSVARINPTSNNSGVETSFSRGSGR